jgi:hypothetical protein
VLLIADDRDPLFWPGDLVPHTETKSPGADRLPSSTCIRIPSFKVGRLDADFMEVTNLPTQAGPVPDRMTIWPIDDGRYGLDATFQGASGYERAASHKISLDNSGVSHSFRQELGGAWTLRFGPLSAADVSVALTAFVR